MSKLLVLISILFGSVSASAHASGNDQWWINKASRSLRGGQSVSPAEMKILLPYLERPGGKDQVIEKFLADPKFHDSILDFNSMYLGFRMDRYRNDKGGFDPAVYFSTPSVLAAQEVIRNGDFFKIFSRESLVVAPPLSPRKVSTPSTPVPDSATDEESRAIAYRSFGKNIDLAIEEAVKAPIDKPALCKKIEPLTELIFNSSLSDVIPFNVLLSNDFAAVSIFYCGSSNYKEDVLAELIKLKSLFQKTLLKLEPFYSDHYYPKSLNDIKTVELGDILPHYKPSIFVGSVLTNSSTNYNRKRAAYVLKRFLCDDLTPINVENPSDHIGGVHGSSPSCYACHYKLDPMAGFFREFGQNFLDYSASKKIIFDDGASKDLSEYVKAWQPGPMHLEFNVGYIRSTRKLETNFYGSSLDDLLSFLKTAPEVRRCLVRRAFDFLVSPNQNVDGEYLDSLTTQFNQDTALHGSGLALKNVFKTIVKSKAYSSPKADRDDCYDRLNETSQQNTPCKISSVLAKNCVKCHASTDDSGGLDLSKWNAKTNGRFGFPHLDKNGKEISAAITFQSMLDRIGSLDREQRMPYRSEMSNQDRQSLYLWLNEQLRGVK